MKKIQRKKVTMLELFYDLIFVFAISRITSMIHHPVNGTLDLQNYVEFLFVVIVVMQIWLYQMLYINRFGKERLIDTLDLLVSMFSMIYLANNINTEWQITFKVFNTAMLVLLADLLVLYIFATDTHPFQDRDLLAFIVTLSIEFLLILIGLLIGYEHGVYLAVIGGLIGFLMPLMLYPMFNPKNVNFPHFVERLGLIVIVTFGETLVNITQFFKGDFLNPLAITIFVSIASLYGVYVLEVDKFITTKQYTRGFILMYSHVVIIISILTLTMGMLYMSDKNVSRNFLVLLMTISLLVFYLGLFVNSVYNQQKYKFKMNSYVLFGLTWIFGLFISWMFRENNLGLISGFALINLVMVTWFGYIHYNGKKASN